MKIKLLMCCSCSSAVSALPLSCDSHLGDAGSNSAHHSLSHHHFLPSLYCLYKYGLSKNNGFNKKVLILESTVMTNSAVEDEDKVNWRQRESERRGRRRNTAEVIFWHIIVIHENILTCRKYLLNLVPQVPLTDSFISFTSVTPMCDLCWGSEPNWITANRISQPFKW